jgi:hypothetical protein
MNIGSYTPSFGKVERWKAEEMSDEEPELESFSVSKIKFLDQASRFSRQADLFFRTKHR